MFVRFSVCLCSDTLIVRLSFFSVSGERNAEQSSSSSAVVAGWTVVGVASALAALVGTDVV